MIFFQVGGLKGFERLGTTKTVERPCWTCPTLKKCPLRLVKSMVDKELGSYDAVRTNGFW